jgi:glyoxylase-like metal-dependent hydrolase (beta-lactamase superfamily II)
MGEGRSSRPVKVGGTSLRRLLVAAGGRLFRTRPAAADELLADGQILPVAGGLRAMETVGHTPGHFSFFAPDFGVVFTGDSIIADDRGLHGSQPVYTWDAAKAGEAVRRQAALGARIVCPGHGPVVREAKDKFPI